MDNTVRHDHALAGTELERAFAFDVEEQGAFEDEEQLVFNIVLVPVELAVEYADASDRIVHLAERLVPPRFLVPIDKCASLDHLEGRELHIFVDVVVSRRHRPTLYGAASVEQIQDH
jgi:hypothetical protein